MKQINWFKRRFDFAANENNFPSLLERLIGTPVRIQFKLQGIAPQYYRLKVDDKWSILEHIGHLADLETLWQGRLEDILRGNPELRPTDLTNRQTDLADHNAKEAEELIEAFRKLRRNTLHQLETITEDQLSLSALHPRLKTPMRIQDLFLFVAEHDDHHLAKMTAIHQSFLRK